MWVSQKEILGLTVLLLVGCGKIAKEITVETSTKLGLPSHIRKRCTYDLKWEPKLANSHVPSWAIHVYCTPWLAFAILSF